MWNFGNLQFYKYRYRYNIQMGVIWKNKTIELPTNNIIIVTKYYIHYISICHINNV